MTDLSTVRHLLKTDALSLQEIEAIFRLAEEFLVIENPQTIASLKDRLVLSVSLEDSTRTRVSFEIAAHRLGAHVVSVTEKGLSLAKGETVEDTLYTLAAMRPDAMVVRLTDTALLEILASHAAFPIISAGEGSLHHPTQALLDAFTIERAKGTVRGLTIAICGDILRSRVAHSNITLLQRLGATIRIVAPAAFQPTTDFVGCERYETLESGIEQADVVMMLRTQYERDRQAMAGVDLPHDFRLDHAKLTHAKPDVIVMHPGPVHRESEITSALADDLRYSHIRQQVTHGVVIRMAVLAHCINTKKNSNHVE